MNASFSEAFNTSFTTSAVEHGKEPIQKKPTANERKRKLRAVYRQCCDKENEARRSTAAISVLTEDHSVCFYTRKRKLQSFQTPPSKRPRPKSHSPNFMNVTWDKESVGRPTIPSSCTTTNQVADFCNTARCPRKELWPGG